MARKKAETIATEEITVTKAEETLNEEPNASIENIETAEILKDKPPEAEPVLEDIPGANAEEESIGGLETDIQETIVPGPEKDAVPDVLSEPLQEEPGGEPLAEPTPENRGRRPRGPERVITIDGKVYDSRTRQNGTAAEIRRHIQRGSILSGSLFAIDQTSGGMPFGIVLYKDMRVIIPAAELIDLTAVEVNEDSTLEREVNAVLNGMLDAEIDFIPKGLDAKNGIVTASRKEAMARQAKRFYITPAISGQPLILENGLAEGRIIRVTLHTVTVELFGVDTVIAGGELSWSWLSDARDVFHVGDTVVVRVLKIDIRDGEVSISASIRQSKPDPYTALDKKIQLQKIYVGEIQSAGYRYIRVTIDDLDCTCPYPDWMDSVVPGTKVTVKIVSINPAQHRIRGSITRVIKEV